MATIKPAFPRLFEPGRIGTMTLRNRVVMPPMATNLAQADGSVSQQNKDYYGARARGGVGLVIVEVTYVESAGKILPRQLAVDDDRCLPGLRELAQAIKRHGARAALQLHHGGNATRSSITGRQILGPSAVARPGYEVPRPLTVEEIEGLVAAFARAAGRAKRAGFDGVEIHAAHYYLLAQFLSPAWNKRRDEYGGQLQNRARFLLQVIKAVREEVGRDYPVWCRLNGMEYGVEGITLEETQEVALMAQGAGADALHVSACGEGGLYTAYHRVPMGGPRGHLLPLAEGVKRVVKVPVIGVGRLTLELAEKALEEGRVDFVAIGRPHIADPELCNKAASGRWEDIIPCIYCNTCGDITIYYEEGGVRCTVNPATGREGEAELRPAERRKRVLVVGGGPGGMEAARVAALRGHEVTLYEKKPRLGGQALLSVIPPGKSEIQPFLDYLEAQVRKAGVRVVLGQEVSAALVEEMKPDAVILATGGIPFIPDIPGLDRARVATAEEVLTGKRGVGERVLLIGGEMVGCETADFLSEKGKKVMVTTMEPSLASKVGVSMRERLLTKLAQRGATLLAGVRYEEVSGEGAVVLHQGKRVKIEADSIVIAAGSRPNMELLQEIQGQVPEVHLVGDCVEHRTIRAAVAEGFWAASAL